MSGHCCVGYLEPFPFVKVHSDFQQSTAELQWSATDRSGMCSQCLLNFSLLERHLGRNGKTLMQDFGELNDLLPDKKEPFNRGARQLTGDEGSYLPKW